MIYGYIRISTDRQTLENQEFEIKNFAQNQNLQIDRWVKETISGTKESLARLKAGGKKLGRSFGSRNKKHILDGKEQDIVVLLKKGVPKARIARLLGVSTSTIYNFLEKQLPGSEFIRHNLRYTNSKSNEH